FLPDHLLGGLTAKETLGSRHAWRCRFDCHLAPLNRDTYYISRMLCGQEPEAVCSLRPKRKGLDSGIRYNDWFPTSLTSLWTWHTTITGTEPAFRGLRKTESKCGGRNASTLPRKCDWRGSRQVRCLLMPRSQVRRRLSA